MIARDNKRTEINNAFMINPIAGKKYSPTPVGKSVNKVFCGSISVFVIIFFIIYPQPDRKAATIKKNKTTEQIVEYMLLLAENIKYRFDNKEKSIKGVANVR